MKKNLLFLMLSALGIGAWAQLSSPYTGSTVAEGEFYLYNVKSGLWLQNNNTKIADWTTRASLGMYGLDWTIATSTWDATGYAIGAKFGKPSIWNEDSYIDWHGDGSTWTFTSVSISDVTNTYRISSGTNKLGAVSYNETNKANNLFTESGDNRWYLQYPNDGKTIVTDGDIWQLVTKTERLNYMVNASREDPRDATWLIGDPDFSDNNTRHSKWKITNSGDGGNTTAIGNADNDSRRGVRAWELWRPKGSNTFDYYQIMDVPNGIYGLSLQGFTRHGQPDQGESVLYSESESHTVYYYANDIKHRMNSIFSDAKTTSSGNFTDQVDNYYIPNNVEKATKAINNENAYVNEEIEVVVTDGNLRIGVKREGSPTKADWTVIDNFKLTYYGPNITSGEDYYFYNVGSGLWLQSNEKKPSEWSTRAELGERGMNIGVTAITGGYQLNPHFNREGGGTPNNSINGSGLYMDTDNAVTAWTISSVPGTEYVTIKTGNNYLGSDGSAEKYLTTSSNLSGDNAYWRMYSTEEYYNVRKQEMLTATNASPKDATWLIVNPTFPNNDMRNDNYWEKNYYTEGGAFDLDGDETSDNKNGIHCNLVWEAWNCRTVSMTQELTNLPAGVYRMSVQGFYNCSDGIARPYYFAQNSTSGKIQRNFMFVEDGVHDDTNCAANATDGGVNGQWYASKCIYYGHYQNPWIYFVVGSDKESTTIGVKKETYVANDWLVYDNFKLEYLGAGYDLAFNENNSAIDDFVGLATSITTTRSLKAGYWNTFCVPFPMTAAQIEDQLGEDAEVKELTDATQNGDHYTLNFDDAENIEAGKPYMVKVSENEYNGTIEIENASGIAVNTTGTPSVTEGGVTFTGVYTSGTAPEGSFIISNNVFYNVNSTVALKAFRGYITVPDAEVKALNFTFDDDATAIEMVNGQSSMVNEIYNLAGQRISKMQKGINIVNGKKILK